MLLEPISDEQAQQLIGGHSPESHDHYEGMDHGMPPTSTKARRKKKKSTRRRR
jgi:hypothetical protein